ncbi:MAG: UDP-N-acetylmuramoyl-L-alanine--D-glutamate ligase [Candidatus Omnitrophota bacterium]
MRNEDYFKNKRVTIIGLARSGVACANLLYELGADVSVTDSQDNESTRANASRLKSREIKLELGKHSPEFLKKRDLVVISPGVPDTSPAVAWAEKSRIPIISEIEFGWFLCPATVIAVTGTNGKTTVTVLIGKILEAKGENVFVCGNIGNPFCGELSKIKPGDFVSLEVSSFQLERIQMFKPKVSLILNLSRNHLDRYKDMQEYLEAKKRIFMNQDENDYLVLNNGDPIVRGLAKEAKAKAVYFDKDPQLNPNQSAVLAVGSILGVDRDLCLDVFKSFKGVEHRLEHAGESNNVRFINDSKATTVDSTVWALNNISCPIILIAGGREKGNDYSIISDLVKQKVREAVLIGESKKKIEEAFKGFLPVEQAETLEEAVTKAFHKARPGDCVLFSPMCKSFDMFLDYEERGRLFKKAVSDLINQPK